MTYQNQWRLYISRLFGIGANNVLQLGDGANFVTADFRLQIKLMRKINVNLPPILPYCQIAVVPSVFSHSSFHVSIVGYASAPSLSRKHY